MSKTNKEIEKENIELKQKIENYRLKEVRVENLRFFIASRVKGIILGKS